jgi:hypothetical protein
MQKPVPRVFTNPLTLLGGAVALVSLALSAVTLALDFFGPRQSPYLGILTFFIFPAFLFLGILTALLGLYLTRRRIAKRGPGWIPPPVTQAELSAQHRLYLALGGVGFLIVMLSVVGGYRAYEFTESVAFCGKTCHSVMEPEYVAYQGSPHARVKCVECHVGSGPEWYLKSKLNGLHQVYSLATGSFARPISTPIRNLRPAQETCEQCHWPEKSWGRQLVSRIRYGFDPLNTRHEVLLLMKTGGGSPTRGMGEGIHWHMNLAHRIEYMARDGRRLDIPWVRSVSAQGETVEYFDTEKPPTAREIETLEHRRIDCLDCHNRPAHVFLSAGEGVDHSFEAGRLDPAIPSLKEAAVLALSQSYPSVKQAEEGIESALKAYYGERASLAPALEGKFPAVLAELQQVYRSNFFPGMKVNWDSYPNHIGHREFPGCFRCHDDRHRSPTGKVIRKDCDLCHTLAARSRDGTGLDSVPASGASVHPWKHEKHSRIDCWQCHTSTASPYKSCGKCHEPEAGAPMAFACSGCHKPLKVKVENGDCSGCHEMSKSKLHALAAHRDCIACHKQHEWKTVAYPDDCTQACHKTLKAPHHPGEPCAPCHDWKGVTSLRGPPPAVQASSAPRSPRAG